MSTLDFRDLPEDRLATTDVDGSRMWIIPARVRGVWHNRRKVFQIVLLIIFVFTPWLRFRGEPIVLLDILARKFIFFGKIFSAHDAPYLFFVLGIVGLSFILVTALWGRVWCGWACPQTVFVELVFRGIERLVVGNRAEQLASRKNPFRLKYFLRLFLKWSLFILISVFLAHTFIAYFVSWERLLFKMGQAPAESWPVFIAVFFFASLLLFDFAWFREQFCIIMCPYGRFQSVLMDNSSSTVAYDYNRGEPRARKITEKVSQGAGDCIDCYKCVSVCPTGIDIRNGQQMECVACTACMDACDEVMTKIKRPTGLIRYSSLNSLEGGEDRKISPRIYGYLAGISLLVVGFIYSLQMHQEFYFNILRQSQRPYAVLNDGSKEMIINNFRIHFKNPSHKQVKVSFSLIEEKNVEMAPPQSSFVMAVGEDKHFPFFLKFSKAHWELLDSPTVTIKIQYGENQKHQTLSTVNLIGPQGNL